MLHEGCRAPTGWCGSYAARGRNPMSLSPFAPRKDARRLSLRERTLVAFRSAKGRFVKARPFAERKATMLLIFSGELLYWRGLFTQPAGVGRSGASMQFTVENVCGLIIRSRL